jgi:NADH dehydrogenase/NADH:ubiquinone oxidoreductase subunit G
MVILATHRTKVTKLLKIIAGIIKKDKSIKKMKEYKILVQKEKFLKNSDTQFEVELNNLAKEGWRILNTVRLTHSNALKVIMERDKNR